MEQMNKINFCDLELSKGILEALELLEYTYPTEVQEKVIPLVLSERDVVVKSQTGSGKTAAFGIPLCEKLKIEIKEPQVLILTPTRELAVQVKEELSNIGRYKALRCIAVFGKQPVMNEIRELKQRVHAIVGTPGRVLDHLAKGRINVNELKYLCIDEADKMLSMGFIDQVEGIIKELVNRRVTLLFSATIPKEIEELSKKYMTQPINLEIEHKKNNSENITQYLYITPQQSKFELLKKIIYTEKIYNSIIFLNTREEVDKLKVLMKKEGFSVEALHGGLEQKERLEVINSFKEGSFSFLIATDVAARGIHVDEVTHIINYDIPMEPESYVHRIGRTGRAGKAGIAITFVTPYQNKFLMEIEDLIGYDINKAEMLEVADLEEFKTAYKATEVSIIKTKKLSMKKDAKTGITKIYIGGGKKKKLRAGDIVGAITNIEGITIQDIGIIDVQDNISYVDIFAGKGDYVIKELSKVKIKGKSLRIARADKIR